MRSSIPCRVSPVHSDPYAAPGREVFPDRYPDEYPEEDDTPPELAARFRWGLLRRPDAGQAEERGVGGFGHPSWEE